MPIQVDGVLVRAMSGNELSRVRTEFRLRLPEPINKSLLESRGRHCYAIMWVLVPKLPVSRVHSTGRCNTI
jgi:hypothetical protein